MKYRVERREETQRDLGLIFDFLASSYLQFGEDIDESAGRARARLKKIDATMDALGRAPHQGTLHNELLPGLRSVTKDDAIFYFDVDDEQRVVTVLAVFFGGQDHKNHMLKRLRGS